ncbi:hypothetical protein Avbf_00447 [Armadillidium vulgare]|nr:hypothetical protein Avbf_00447 [Armadillidium vulgare]
MEDISYKTRTQGAVGSERMTLLCIIAHYWDELERYENEGGTQRQKWDLWETIANEFNGHPNVSVIRTPLQVKTLFKNMKTKARKYKQKLEESRALGIIVETDPISETVLKLNKYQSREALDTILQPLKSLYYFSRENFRSMNMSTLKEDEDDFNFTLSSSLAADMQKMADDEVVKLEDKPPEENENSPTTSVNETFLTSVEESVSQAVTFGDISVTAITGVDKKDKKDSQYKYNSTLKLGSSNLESPLNIDTNKKFKSSFQQLNNPLKRLFSSLENETHKPTTSSNENLHSPLLSQHCSTSKQCCCPDYHSEMVSMLLKEHEMKMNLLTEEILCQRAERSLYEEERRIREQNFLFKQEERQDSIAEHQARMKVIELECEALEARIKSHNKNNRWFLNGSKEI